MIREYGVHLKGGIIAQRDADYCTIRLRLPAGILDTARMLGIAKIADTYGSGTVHLTTRQTIEIPDIHHLDLEEVTDALQANGTPVGAETDEVVNIIACPGTARCKYANIDSISLAQRVDEKVFGKQVPVKVRISISACPYACTSPLFNEIGVIGRIEPLREPGLCTGCGTCAEYCKECAIIIKNGVSVLDSEKCIMCGVCIHSCPFDLLKSKHLHSLITVGGRRGRHPQMGRELVAVETEDEAVEIIDRIVAWVRRRAWSGRLLADQLDDLQFEQFKADIISDLEK
ncbi:MAG: 4Fe-4S binding protein [Methanomicrobiaceae archaeon]|nr:4Fe-4S binding protein [Methanomicrobiaceae archaeon]